MAEHSAVANRSMVRTEFLRRTGYAVRGSASLLRCSDWAWDIVLDRAEASTSRVTRYCGSCGAAVNSTFSSVVAALPDFDTRSYCNAVVPLHSAAYYSLTTRVSALLRTNLNSCP